MSRTYEAVQERLHDDVATAETVGEAVAVAADLWPDDPYLAFAPTGERFTYGELDARVDEVAAALHAAGVEQGDRVGLYLENGPTYVVAAYACAKLGAVQAPINWMYREREVSHAVESAEMSAVLVGPDDEYHDRLAPVAREYDRLDTVVVTEGDAAFEGADTHALPALVAEADDPPTPDVAHEDPLAILYTSGTTGLPKPAVLSHQSYLLGAKSFLGAPVSPDGTNFNPYPLFHANNQVYSMLGSLLLGGEYVLADSFSASGFFDVVTEYGVTSFNIIGGVPKMLDATHDDDEIPDTSLDLAIGPISDELWDRFQERFDLDVVQIYSQTESTTLLMNHPDLDARKPTAIGKPMFPDLGHEAWVLDEAGEEVPAGETGELVRTDPGCMDGYWNMPEKTTETLREGKIHSGDVVRRDEEGFLYYVDRKKFMIRRGGENISAQEIETVVDELPGVAESAAIPVPDEMLGETVKVLVMRADETVTERDVVAHVAATLAPYKVPRYVEFTDSFPRTPTERIRRVELADAEEDREDHGWDRDEAFPDWEP
ncbi:class I adenylate-forming enzyme family protein [Halorarius halobius]|uniref:class I adenylate-forming enzyme family protein n=1 Tax=Halorarius halobius TaxID=2962671 RepID=UPI0020CF773F|nr:class I adenylate-forming enzyme family protein [Halorarius halobius]